MEKNLVPCQCAVNMQVRFSNGSRNLKPKRKSKRGKSDTHRSGFKNADGLTFLPPKFGAELWRKKMEEKGYSFG